MHAESDVGPRISHESLHEVILLLAEGVPRCYTAKGEGQLGSAIARP